MRRKGWRRIACWLPVALCLLAQGVAATEMATDEEESEPDEWTKLSRAIDELWSGRPDERRVIVEDPDDLFDLFECDDDECDPEAVGPLIGSLHAFLRLEQDDWITSRLLETLSLVDAPALAPLFRDALDGRSPNVRWQAIRFYADETDPDVRPALEDVWRDEIQPWVRADLVRALSRLGSETHLADLLKLDVAGHPDLLAAAIKTLGIARMPGSVAFLSKIVQRGRPLERSLALEALASWPESPEALQVVLGASHVSLPGVRRCALGALGEFDSPAAAGRLIEVARSGETPDERFAAIGALTTASHPDVVPVLVEILHEAASPFFQTLHPLVIRVLASIDDPGAVPGLLDLDPALGGENWFNVGVLIRYLSRDRSTGGVRSVYFSGPRTCRLDPLNPDDGEVLRVSPPLGSRTVRCWKAPGVAGDPEEHPRLTAGTLVVITDYFERDEGIWVSVDGAGKDGCWSPLRFLSDAREPPVAMATGPALTLEIDLPAEETALDSARILADNGLLRLLDPWEHVVGVALEIDPDDEEEVMTLAQCRAFDASLLDQAILELARPLALRYRGHEALGPLLRFALGDGTGEDAGPQVD